MLDLHSRGLAIDLVTLKSELQRTDELDLAGGATFVASLVDGVPKAANALFYAGIIRDAAIRREAAKEFDRLRNSALRQDLSLDELAAQAHGSGLLIEARSDARHEQIVLTRLSDVEPSTVEWLWPPYLPLGKLTILEGDPGVGKSHISVVFASLVSTGRAFPGQDARPREPQDVVLLNCEDDLSDTVRPRLDRAGADVGRVSALEGKGEEGGRRLVTLKDIADLSRVFEDRQPALLIVDPLQAFLGARVDMHRANEVRPILQGLAVLAARYRCAVILIRHLAKSDAGGKLQRGLGSIDFTAAARSVLLAGRDPRDSEQRHLVQTKCNVAREGGAMGYQISEQGLSWTGPSTMTAEILLARGKGGKETLKGSAMKFLRSALADGPRLVSELQADVESEDFSWRTVQRASETLRVTHRRSDSAPGDEWTLDRSGDA